MCGYGIRDPVGYRDPKMITSRVVSGLPLSLLGAVTRWDRDTPLTTTLLGAPQPRNRRNSPGIHLRHTKLAAY